MYIHEKFWAWGLAVCWLYNVILSSCHAKLGDFAVMLFQVEFTYEKFYPLTPYYCRLGYLLCFVFICVLIVFFLLIVYSVCSFSTFILLVEFSGV